MQKITEFQKEILCSFMEKHPKLAKGVFDSQFTRHHYDRLWAELAKELNSAGGAMKEVKKWRKTWSDLKSAAKQKAAAIKRSQDATGGGYPKSEDEMEDSYLNNRITNIIGETVIFGIRNVDEYGVKISNNDEDLNENADEGDEIDQPETARPGSSRNLSKKAMGDKWLKISERKAMAMEKLAAATERQVVAAERKAAALEKIAASMEVVASSFKNYIPDDE